MSTRARTPRAEQPEVEPTPEEPTPDELEEEEPEQAPELEREADPVDVQQAKIDNARRKYHKDLRGIVGDLEGTDQCPTCDGLGLVPSALNMVSAPEKERCTDCRGLGLQLTGSLVDHQVALPCLKCNGQGWVNKRPENVHDLPTPQGVQPPLPALPVAGTWDPQTQTFTPYASQVPS